MADRATTEPEVSSGGYKLPGEQCRQPADSRPSLLQTGLAEYTPECPWFAAETVCKQQAWVELLL